MFRSLSQIVCAVSLLVGLAACDSLGRDIVAHSECFDPVKEEFFCCDDYTPRDHPACSDGAADAGADASDDGSAGAGSDDGGPPAAVCPWPCTPTGGGGFDPFPSYVWIENEGISLPQPLDGLEWNSWVGVKFAEPTCPACSCVAPTNPSDGCVLPTVWSAESTARRIKSRGP